jgi:acetyltransferase
VHLVRYREAIDALMETPPSLPADFSPNVEAAREIVQRVIEQGRAWLDPLEAAALLKAYSIPINPVLLARDPEEAGRAAAPLLADGGTVVVKILSPHIVHKSEVGGVRLNLTSETAVREAAAEILERTRSLRPQARITGVTLHPMIIRPKARELIVGLADDPTFGPIVVFGQGGTAVEAINDKALALPPLDLGLARQLIARTRVSRMLKGYRDVPAADETAVALVLVKLAQLFASSTSTGSLPISAACLPSRTHFSRAALTRHATRPWPPAVCNPALSAGMGTTPCPAGRHTRAGTPDPTGGRASLRPIFRACRPGRPAAALFCARQGFRPCLCGSLYVD